MTERNPLGLGLATRETISLAVAVVRARPVVLQLVGQLARAGKKKKSRKLLNWYVDLDDRLAAAAALARVERLATKEELKAKCPSLARARSYLAALVSAHHTEQFDDPFAADDREFAEAVLAEAAE